MNNKEYSNLLIPNVLNDTEHYELKYPKRNLSEGAAVTRFAPSPTGFVHMGSLYTSFSDIQIAHQTKGIVYLRIEDTDQKRELEDGITGIISDFDKLGITFDEGPTQGGVYGPYIQSERGEIYKAYAKKLIEEDLAYPCFCSQEDAKEDRDLQVEEKARIGYYGKYARCRKLSREEVINKINNGEKYIIRLKSPGVFENKIVLKDLIKGNIEMPENDLDIVIIKSDGLPTYHFAHAIDDHLMRTTHVIRGDEWVSSYPIHEQLFKVLGFDLPNYAHIAPITIKEGETIRKLSKRKDPEASISYYHEMGLPTEVIRLYLATVNNYDFETWYNENTNLTIDDYNFEFSKMPVGGSLFDMSKLLSIAKIYFSSLTASEVYNGLIEYTKEYDNEFYNILVNDEDYAIKVLNIERELSNPRKDIACYKDIRELNYYLFDTLFIPKEYEFMKITDYSEISKILSTYIDNYYSDEDDNETWFNKMKVLSAELGYASEVKEYKKNPDIYKGHVGDISTVLRVALTGKNKTPDLHEIMNLLGKEKIKQRFNKLI